METLGRASAAACRESSRYLTFTKEIGPDEEVVLESIPRKTRAAVRKALKTDLASRREFSDPAAFEDLYSKNLHRLGTPCFPARHYHDAVGEVSRHGGYTGNRFRVEGGGRGDEFPFSRPDSALLWSVGPGVQRAGPE